MPQAMGQAAADKSRGAGSRRALVAAPKVQPSGKLACFSGDTPLVAAGIWPGSQGTG